MIGVVFMGLFNKKKDGSKSIYVDKQNNNSEFPFNDQPNTAVFTCIHILNKEKSILYVVHDEDGSWQFLCGDNHTEKDAKIVSLQEIYKLDNTIRNLSGLECGQSAVRNDQSGQWIIR